MRSHTIPRHTDHVPRAVAHAALGHVLQALDDAREDRDMYREMLGVALRQVAQLTNRVQRQSTTIRQLSSRTETPRARQLHQRPAA